MREEIRASLVDVFDEKLVDELLEAHAELKSNFYLGGLRLAEVEGGRFAEAALRLLQQDTTGSYTPLGSSLDSEKVIRDLAALPKADAADSVRLHIPRALRVVYDIRNNRDAAHLGDGIDPNLQDSTLVATNCDWVLAEFVRLYHDVDADEAQRIIEDLVVRTIPLVEDFGGFKKLLKPDLAAGDQCLVLLYEQGREGASPGDLKSWVSPKARKNLKRTLDRLEHEVGAVHADLDRYLITAVGRREVEHRRLFEIV
jgi:hypothetical protein